MTKLLLNLLKKTAIGCLTVILLSTTTTLYAQNAIQLTNIETGKKLKPIITGSRVSYILKPAPGQSGPGAITGILNEVSNTTATVNGVTFNLDNLDRIGQKKKGYGIGSMLLNGFGTALIVGAISNHTREIEPACNGCIVVTEGEDKAMAGTLLLSGIGLGLNVLGIKSIVKNSPRSLQKWNLEVVEVESKM